MLVSAQAPPKPPHPLCPQPRREAGVPRAPLLGFREVVVPWRPWDRVPCPQHQDPSPLSLRVTCCSHRSSKGRILCRWPGPQREAGSLEAT